MDNNIVIINNITKIWFIGSYSKNNKTGFTSIYKKEKWLCYLSKQKITDTFVKIHHTLLL